MAAKDYQLALAAAAKRLSDVYGDGASVVDAAKDIPYRQVLLTIETGPVYIGAASDVSSTNYGITFPATAAPVSLGPFDAGPIKFSDLWVAGTGTLHVLGIPF